MSVHAQVLDRLGGLRPSDRAWILKRLSVRERAALMEGGMQELNAFDARSAGASSAAPSADKKHRVTLLLATAETMTDVLRREPPWLIAAMLALDEWPWAQTVLQSLPGHVRAEVQHLLERSVTLTAAMRDAVLASCAQQVGINPAAAKHSRLKGLLKSMEAALVRKRRTLRL